MEFNKYLDDFARIMNTNFMYIINNPSFVLKSYNVRPIPTMQELFILRLVEYLWNDFYVYYDFVQSYIKFNKHIPYIDTTMFPFDTLDKKSKENSIYTYILFDVWNIYRCDLNKNNIQENISKTLDKYIGTNSILRRAVRKSSRENVCNKLTRWFTDLIKTEGIIEFVNISDSD